MKDAKDVKTSRVSHVRRNGIVLLALFTSSAFFTSLLGAQQTAPTFRSKVEVVQLDVSVLDKRRQPVKGLTEGDFTILEDGKPQRIVGFSTFDIEDAPDAATGWMKDVPPDVSTNDLKPESRLWVIVMDDAMIPQEPFAIRSSKEIAKNIIDSVGPNDLTAIVFTGDNRKTQDFTSDKTKLIAALDKFNPGLTSYRFGLDITGAKGVDTDLWFYQSSVRTLSNIADYLIAVPQRRKALFWVSPGVPLCVIDPKDPRGEGQREENAMCGPPTGEILDLQRRTEEAFRRAQRANVTFYPIDPMGLDGMKAYLRTRIGATAAKVAALALQDDLVSTAVNTGGRPIVNINEFAPEIREIFEENKFYYLIAFEPSNTALDGRLRKLEVKVDRKDVEVRTRSGYYAPEPEKPNKKLDKMTPEAVALAKAMSGMLPNAGMPMRASAAAWAVPGQRLSTVTVVLGVKQPIPESAKNGRVTETTELLTSAYTPEGDARGAQRHTAKVTLRAGADGEAAYEVLAKIDLPAGRYQLRLAAHNTAAAKDGSVFVDVVVPDYSNIPFSASPVVLSASPGRVSAPSGLFTPLLPLVPTAEREFTIADKVTAFLRLYQSGQKPIERVQVTMRVRDASDRVVINDAQVIAVDQFKSAAQEVADNAPPPGSRPPNTLLTGGSTSGDKFANLSLRTADIKYPIALQQLAPGPHLLTIEATLGTTSIRRDIRFTVK